MITNINQACDLIIFGTKGDLAKRKLLPALYKLEKYERIHPDTRIIGAGRADWTQEKYIDMVREAIKTFLNEKIKDNIWKKLRLRLIFFNIDVYKEKYFLELKNVINQKKNIAIYYCAVPPSTFNAIFTGLGKAHLNSYPSRIILEKPLGTCLKTSKKINNQIAKYFLESQIFRIDHYLGKESILNLLSLRFANSFFFHNWNHKIIDHIQITVSEEVGIENRWNYFDRMGQTRDMVQNHLLQILTIIAMNQPNDLTSESIRYEKLKILKALDPINEKNINIQSIRGQYTSGIVNGKKVVSYLEENGANIDSLTETFVALKVNIINKKWSGVPFYLRTGKRLACKYSEIVVVFKDIPKNLFKKFNKDLLPNKLIIRLEPNESIKINFLNKIPGINEKYKLKNNEMEFNYSKILDSKNLVDAYERLLLESMKGTQSLFVCRDEIEEAWNWIDPIVSYWKISNKNNLQLYASGTWGPKNLDSIMTRDDRFWNKFNYK